MQKFCKRVTAMLLLLCFVIGATGNFGVYGAAVKKEKRTETETGRKVRIGYIDYDGFIMEKEDGSYVGYGVEYLEKIAQYTGWSYEYVYDSWENQLHSLMEGKIDFICHAQKTSEREENYLFSKYAIGTESSVLYVRAEDDRYYYNDFSAFDGMKIAILNDSFQNTEFSEYASKKGFEFEVAPYKTQTECFDALDEGIVDGVAMGSLALKQEYKAICRFGSDPFYFMTGKQNQALLDDLDDALGQITASGSFFQADLYQKYYGDLTAGQEVIFTRAETEYIAEAGKIQIACIPSRRPFSYVNEEGEIVGITIDILNLLQEKSGLSFEYVMMPAGMRTAEYLEEHPDALIAGIMSDNPAFQREPYLLTNKFYSDDVALACLNGREYDLNAENQTYKLAIPRSYVALEDYIRNNYPQFEIVECTAMKDCLDLVVRGEVDFTAQNVNVIKPFLANPHYEGITIVPTFFMEENTGIVALDTGKNQMLVDILNKCMETITQKEVAQFTVDHTVANQYRLTWGDMLYKFRYPLIAVGILLLTVIALMTAFVISRKKNYDRIEEKNVQLAEAVAQADSANRAKSQFLARMSHEIRTPMNAIVGLTALTRHSKNEPEKVEEYLDKIETSSRVLLNIINDVLDMSAIESQKLKIAQKPFELREILNAISAVYATQCRQKGVAFEMNMTEINDERLMGDGLRLNQILLNLISNACKFTPEGGRITVTVKEVSRQGENAYYKFTVEDTGEGMTPEMLRRLFLPFEQEGADTAQKYGGSGLGLSIAKNLVELMGGSISCQSWKGKGTVFTVSLPFVLETDEEAFKTAGYQAVQSPDAPEDAYDFGGRKILLAEDTGMNAEIVEELLELVNMKVDHAWDGKEAVRMFTEAQPGTYAAVLMDIQMPVMNGYEAVAAIRSSGHPQARSIPVYAMTANAFTEDVSAALNAGMNGHIAKPIDTVRLYEILKGAVEEQ